MNMLRYLVASGITICMLKLTGQINSPTSIKSNSLKSGSITSMPTTCNTGDLYIAIDQEQPLQVCMENSYHPFVSMGASGAVSMRNGEVDIVPNVVPRLATTNKFTGYNSFNLLKLVPKPTNLDCNSDNLGIFWFDNSDNSNSQVKVCGNSKGKAEWLTLLITSVSTWQAR
jgi:hypothetical protein